MASAVTHKVRTEAETLWKPNWPRLHCMAPHAYVVIYIVRVYTHTYIYIHMFFRITNVSISLLHPIAFAQQWTARAPIKGLSTTAASAAAWTPTPMRSVVASSYRPMIGQSRNHKDT